MKGKISIVILLFMMGGGVQIMRAALENKKHDLKNLVPSQIQGWEAVEEDQWFDSETIFDYIDGAGEVYRSYNFQLLLARKFIQEGKPDIIVDLFDMEKAKNAFGVFTHDLEGEDVKIGQGSTYKGGLLSFWKDRYFVSLYAEEETPEARKALEELGREIGSRIKSQGSLPSVVGLFPKQDLVEKSLCFFHTHLVLNYHYFVADENILLLDQNTDAGLALYKDKCRLLVVEYPQKKQAEKAYANFSKAYMPDAVKPGLVQTENKKWTALGTKENILAVVFDAPLASYAEKLVKRAIKEDQ